MYPLGLRNKMFIKLKVIVMMESVMNLYKTLKPNLYLKEYVSDIISSLNSGIMWTESNFGSTEVILKLIKTLNAINS
jgi:hypothetical protein